MIINIESLLELNEELKVGKKVIFFSEITFRYCQKALNELEDYVGEYRDVDVLVINCQKLKNIVNAYHVNFVPTFLVFLDNKERGMYSGFLDEKELFKFLDSSLKI